jgi:hypothetical protein
MTAPGSSPDVSLVGHAYRAEIDSELIWRGPRD